MSTPKPLAIVLLGPTASGKTALALEIAEQIGLPVHNIDSRQIYIGMDIGTAKPTKAEQTRVVHSLIDLRQPNQPITVKEFQAIAQKNLEKAFEAIGMAFLVGGSGLYLKALTEGLIPPAVSPQNHLRIQLKSLGQSICYQLLESADPNAARKISSTDSVRTQRALEVLYATGKPISCQQEIKPPPWKILELGLDPQDLRERIARRTVKLYENGLIEETEQLSMRFGRDLPMLQTIGYQEALKIIEGQLNTTEAIAITTKRTQQFAKRQRTWFRRQHNPFWLNDQEPLKEALSLIETLLGLTV